MPLGEKRVSLSRAESIAKQLVKKMRDKGFVQRAKIAGAIRRKEDEIGDIDILVILRAGKEDAWFAWAEGTLDPLGGGPERYSGTYWGLPVRILLTEPRAWGAALIYWTGPKGYNISRRKVAKDRGFKLSQHGLFSAKGRYLVGATESDVFERIGITDRKPEDRGKRKKR